MKKWLKKGMSSEYIIWIAIAVAVLVIVLLGIFVLKDKGLGALDAIKNLFRGR